MSYVTYYRGTYFAKLLCNKKKTKNLHHNNITYNSWTRRFKNSLKIILVALLLKKVPLRPA